jgi:hypothetical protein
MTWTLLVAMAPRSCRRRRTAPLQPQGQLGGGDKKVLPLDGVAHRRLVVVVVVVGEALRPVEEEALEEAPGGVEVQVLGHPLQPVDGVPVPTQQLVRGVQEAAAGEQAAQLETPPAGVAPIRRRKAAGTCDSHYPVAPRGLYL